jgi:hypothetical protein
MKRLRQRAGGVVFAVAVAVIVGSGAYAYWSATGGGTGGALAGPAVNAITISPGTPDSALYPGGQASVTLVVDNPNTVSVHINNLVLDPTQGTSGFAVDTAHKACGVSSLSFTSQNNAGAGWDVPAAIGSTPGEVSISLPNSISMAASAPNSCQGAVFTVYLTGN